MTSDEHEVAILKQVYSTLASASTGIIPHSIEYFLICETVGSGVSQ